VTITLAAAPTGARVGLAFARKGDQQVSVTVAPKMWRPPGPRQLRSVQEPWRGHTDLSLYETERLQISTADTDVEGLIWELLGASRRMDSGSPSWDSSLLTPDIPFKGGAPTGDLGHRDLTSATSDLLRLFDRVDLLHTTEDDLLGGASRSPLHRPLLYRRFIDAVAKQVETVRPGYRRVSEFRSTIRGRLDATSAVLWQAGAASGLTCHYESLTLSTDLLRCVCAALEWVADGRGAGSRLPNEYSDKALRHDAVALRRVLSEVAASNPRDALAVGRTLRLGRLDQGWSESLALTLMTLAELEVTASDAQASAVTAVELSVPSDRLWERIVTEALHRAGFENVIEQARRLTSDPWVKSPRAYSHTYPDNVARQNLDVFVVDAKYKTPLAGVAPCRDDQYQMFAYSHLVQDRPRLVRAAVLFYPGSQPRAEWIRGRSEDSLRPVELFAVQLPFPTPEEVASSKAWDRYMVDAGARLGREIGIVEKAVGALSA
jgi:5-methylcytosine-specific restriction endonuclease McrBC regulatory subunit McrC